MTTRAPIDTCVHCGEPEAAHHEFEAATVPGRGVSATPTRGAASGGDDGPD